MLCAEKVLSRLDKCLKMPVDWRSSDIFIGFTRSASVSENPVPSEKLARTDTSECRDRR
jgi:hypothetical protein